MKWIRKTFIFLASVYFAIILIASVALFVVFGTFLESFTESHRFAAFFTYNNPLFVVLLWGFFINILFSALRRWPFKPRHVPFLITHFGLLLILGGTLIKSYWGIQGSLSLLEGSGSEEIALDDTYAIRRDKRQDMSTTYYPLKRDIFGRLNHPDLEIVGYAPHSVEKMETWLKGSWGYITGLQPFPVKDLTVSTKVRFIPDSQPWNVFAGRVSDIAQTAKQLYLQNLQMELIDPVTGKTTYKGPLKGEIDFSFSTFEGFIDPHIVMENIKIPLNGNNTVNLQQTPAIVFLQDMQNDVYVFAFDPYGRVFEKTFRNDNLDSFISYDSGFGGYAVQVEIPFANSISRKEQEEKQVEILANELRKVATFDLSLPLQLLREAADVDFASCCVDFFQQWRHTKSWLFPKDRHTIIEKLNWDSLSNKDKKACYWIHLLFNELEPRLSLGENILSILKDKKWPLLEQLLHSSKPEELLTQQIALIADQLPDPPKEQNFNSRLFSALCRLHGTYPENIEMPQIDVTKSFVLECPLTIVVKEETPQIKLEDNHPLITLKITHESKSELIDLAFDRFGKGLKWPVLNGEYTLRFQPQMLKMPYRLRLRHARQVNYPHSTQPYSYEGDIIITDSRSQTDVEATLSMNNVYETWEGYRFYLANISPPNETAAKRVHIVVNYDPAKYWITYPGAIILTIGICLLFWFRKKT